MSNVIQFPVIAGIEIPTDEQGGLKQISVFLNALVRPEALSIRAETLAELLIDMPCHRCCKALK